MNMKNNIKAMAEGIQAELSKVVSDILADVFMQNGVNYNHVHYELHANNFEVELSGDVEFKEIRLNWAAKLLVANDSVVVTRYVSPTFDDGVHVKIPTIRNTLPPLAFAGAARLQNEALMNDATEKMKAIVAFTEFNTRIALAFLNVQERLIQHHEEEKDFHRED